MKRILLAGILCFCPPWLSFAQQMAAEAPATKEDVQKYFEVTHSRKMMLQMADAMVQPMHQMVHEQYLKDKDKLPADFEARVNQMVDESMKSFPWDEALDAMAPVYAKHFTKAEISALTAFYGTPAGQKVLREMPAIVAEAMQSMIPLMRKQMDTMKERVQQEIAKMKKDSSKP